MSLDLRKEVWSLEKDLRGTLSEPWLMLQNWIRVKRIEDDGVGDKTLENFNI